MKWEGHGAAQQTLVGDLGVGELCTGIPHSRFPPRAVGFLLLLAVTS